MTVSDICNRHVIIGHKDETIVDAAKRMREFHVGDLIVVEERKGGQIPVGILTDRDIVVGVVAKDGSHVDKLLVGDIMTREIVVAQEEESLSEVVKKMRTHGIRRLPVVDRTGKLLGITTLDDLLELFSEQLTDLALLVGREQRQERERRI